MTLKEKAVYNSALIYWSEDVEAAVKELKEKVINEHKICSDPQACTCDMMEDLIDEVFG